MCTDMDVEADGWIDLVLRCLHMVYPSHLLYSTNTSVDIKSLQILWLIAVVLHWFASDYADMQGASTFVNIFATFI